MADATEEFFSFGICVRRRRKALDLTQGALAQQAGCAEVTIRKLEADTLRPSREIAERLAVCLQIPPDEQALFLHVARAERSVDRLPAPHVPRNIQALPLAPPPMPKDQLPVDIAPPPAALPPGSRMPLSRNPLFVGREQTMSQLAHALKAGTTVAIGQLQVAAATGLGGIGKTQLACEFVHRYGQFFPGGVLWLNFADPEAVPAEVAACGGADGMQLSPEFGAQSLDEQVRRVLTAWSSPIPRLLVFDNCEDETLLEQWKPKYGGCRVLITSRRAQWDATLGVQPLRLEVLVRTESIALLRRFRPDLPDTSAELDAIAAALGDLPLAMHLAGSFLAKYRHALTPAQYLRRLQMPTILDDRSLREAGLSPTQHVQHVARTFEQSYAQLAPVDPIDALALQLIARAAYLAPGESIPRSLLLQTRGLPDDLDAILQAEDAIVRLIDLGLVETDEDNIRVHRLLVAFVRAVTQDTAAQAAVEAALQRVVDQLNSAGDLRTVIGLQSHLRFITDAAQQRASEKAGDLCTTLGDHLWMIGDFKGAQHYHEQALAIWAQTLGPEHPNIVLSLNNLGLALYEQAAYTRARQYHEQALNMSEQLLGKEDLSTARSLHFLGRVLWGQGEYPQARAYQEQALDISKRLLGEEHHHTILILQSLGGVLWSQGEYAEARSYLERALMLQVQVLGSEHLALARSMHSLALVLWAQGAYAEAVYYYQQALVIRKQILGMEHPEIAQTLSGLGEVMHAQGAYTEAEQYYKQALEIQESIFGMEHPDTARSLNGLGLILQAQGDIRGAQYCHERALAIEKKLLGDEHPDTAWTLNKLGEVMYLQGAYTEAQQYYEQALALWKQLLGFNHPETARSLNGLGEALSAQGNYAGAKLFYQEALTIQKRV
ncbi:MAG: tetratricopeptide repeat protein, partial [Chloroflexi bacterium]|nr:tetratricopeptide repeat protein [Chloroflexota bacterium]